MPKLSQVIEKRLQDLIADQPPFAAGAHPAVDQALRVHAYGWCASAASIIEAVTPPGHPYRMAMIPPMARLDTNPAGTKGAMLSLLHRLQADFEAGLLTKMETQVAAQTFDDLLDHAQEYLRQRRKEPAGILTGVVFEDTIRQLCRRHKIVEMKRNLDLLLSELVNNDIIKPIDRDMCTAAAKLRTSATHARWDEFEEHHVGPVLTFTRRLICEKLAV
jgi:hypothetical protein